MIGIITSNLPAMVEFYHQVMGFEIELQLEQYVEFKSANVRFALSTNQVMADTTGHVSFTQPKQGQSLELAFAVDTPAAVDDMYAELVEKGATPIKASEDKPWGQRAAFFADPDGNIHEVFAELGNDANFT